MRCALLVLVLSFTIFAQSQPAKQPAADKQKRATANNRGTEQSPIFVQVVPSPKIQNEASKGKTTERDQSSPDWWMVWLTSAIVFIGVVQTIVFGRQAYRLKQTIEKMDEIAGKQTQDVQASIAQSTRAATAMEGVAISMASNVESVRESVGISREIADRQELITEVQTRAYITAVVIGVVPQNRETGYKYEPRVQIVNRGNTPAYDIRFSIMTDVMDFPLVEEFNFPLPDRPNITSSIIAPNLDKILSAPVPDIYQDEEATIIREGGRRRIVTWGIVKYKDVFGTERCCRFGFTFVGVGKRGDDTFMSQDTARHNDST